MDVFEAMRTCRAMRYLKPDPVDDDLIEKIITAATWAPSPGNSQGRRFHRRERRGQEAGHRRRDRGRHGRFALPRWIALTAPIGSCWTARRIWCARCRPARR